MEDKPLTKQDLLDALNRFKSLIINRIDSLEVNIDKRFDAMDRRFDAMEKRQKSKKGSASFSSQETQ
jgi:hypothetical protein